MVKPALPALAHLIHSNDEEVLTDACWALSYLSDGTNDKIQAVIEADVCGRLVELLVHPSPSVLIPALRTVGNIVTADDTQTQCTIEHQSFPCLLKFLANNFKKSINKEACWAVSNITARNKEQIQIKYEIVSYLSCLESYLARIVTVYLEGLENILKVGKADKNLGSSRGGLWVLELEVLMEMMESTTVEFQDGMLLLC
ncbi:hypothetical protein J1N35_044277 [Gossypium stocksii]|uniref:IBB domain-containing protein n=1 Tax=Gossypium stocksii TaxID=47602 RepID=A0A9D3U966_9ROSI|nr:hypothetical protein J1N35_044277 [Gossypium stocksii]